MILDSPSVDRDVTLRADVVVVGSGAGGAVVAHELAEHGARVVVLEKGSYLTSRDFTQREEAMYPRLYADDGARSTVDTSLLISQGQAVGGSTIPSFCVCARPPRAILDFWEHQVGIPGVGAEAMTAHYEAVEAALQVRVAAPEQVNRNNAVVQTGAERLGFHHARLAHNLTECLGCGYCALGCSYARKNDALAVHLREASARGAIIVPDCAVDAIVTERGRAVGVRGAFRPNGALCTVTAKVVVLAAGAIAAPQLWLRSRLPNSSRQVGRNLRVHPQVVVAAEFDDRIAGWEGLPQSIVVDEFLKLNGNADGGFLLMPLFAPPIGMAALLPGFGADARAVMEAYPRLSLLAVMLHDRSSGRVEVDSGGQATITYQLNDDDRVELTDALRRAADIYFAAGATRVLLPFNDLVELSQRGDYRALDEHLLRANDPLLLSFHPQGTLRMGTRANRAVLAPTGEAHEVPGLFVADASVFPTAVAVPPQLSVMAFARRTARYIANKGL